MLNIGLIGYGKMGRIRAQHILPQKHGTITKVFDPNLTDCDYPMVPSETEIINDPAIDVVFISTPNHRTPILVKQALEAGKHVFAEKPPALNGDQMQEIVELAKRYPNQKLMYGFNHRHHQSIQKMKSIIGSGEMGKVLWLRGRYGKEVDETYFDTWRARKEEAGAGIMLDQGIHMLDLFLYLSGGFDQVHAFVSNLYWKIEGIEDNVFAIFKNSESGVCASLHSTMTQWRYLFSLEVFLEKGALILNGLKTSSGVYGDEDLAIKRNTPSGSFSEEEHIIYHSDTSWGSEIEHFFNCIQTRDPIALGNADDALDLMRIMDKIYGQ